jgi:hypothetical protein
LVDGPNLFHLSSSPIRNEEEVGFYGRCLSRRMRRP